MNKLSTDFNADEEKRIINEQMRKSNEEFYKIRNAPVKNNSQEKPFSIEEGNKLLHELQCKVSATEAEIKELGFVIIVSANNELNEAQKELTNSKRGSLQDFISKGTNSNLQNHTITLSGKIDYYKSVIAEANEEILKKAKILETTIQEMNVLKYKIALEVYNNLMSQFLNVLTTTTIPFLREIRSFCRSTFRISTQGLTINERFEYFYKKIFQTSINDPSEKCLFYLHEKDPEDVKCIEKASISPDIQRIIQDSTQKKEVKPEQFGPGERGEFYGVNITPY